MLCEKCGKYHATTHMRTVVNGVAKEQNLCDYCAAGEGLNVTPKSIFASMFGEMLELKPQNMKRCPVCHSTFNDIAKSGKAGCSECYKTFKTELLPYLKRVHGSTHHIGKAPENNDGINELKAELKRLVREEKYVQAAVLRDKIKEMEANANG